MARGKRGGYQKPSRPAAVSGTGANARRTDGGPSDTQPIRTATGQPYGDAGRQEAMQRAVPLPQDPAVGGGGTPSAPTGSASPPPGPPPTSVFAQPSTRPGMPPPPTAGNRALPGDPDTLLRAMYVASRGHPDIRRLMQDGG